MKVNFGKLQDTLRMMMTELPEAVETGLNELAEQAAHKARTETFYIPRGGDGLREATQAFSQSQFVKGVRADKFYASWVNFGNGPPGSKIYPTQANNLRFVINGQVFYRKWVMASEPKPFFTNMIDWTQHNAEDIMLQHLQSFFNRLT